MALISCGECGRQVSEKALACPQCGAPVATGAPAPESLPPGVPPNWREELAEMKAAKKRTRPIFLIAIAAAVVGAFLVRRAVTSSVAAPPSAGLRAAFRQPQKLVSERTSLKEGQAMMYSFDLRSDARLEVRVNARPKSVDVMLMTAAELERFKKAMGELFGGKYTYRRALSGKSVLDMKETETLPAGNWAIVVRRPQESVLFADDTAASVEVTAY
jgi:hypothetical protein